MEIKEIKVIDDHEIEGLSNLLKTVVDDGASIGFLRPMKKEEAVKYWQSVLKPEVKLFIARRNNELVGSVQLHLSTKQNGTHRAEIAKLMTHPDLRLHGIGRTLMQIAEERAKIENRTLLILDTREGDPSNKLYTSLGYIESGRIPNYAKSANGELHTTVLYHKMI
jgi:ribosomal protein S18 acetylase RimI-like enzyme